MQIRVDALTPGITSSSAAAIWFMWNGDDFALIDNYLNRLNVHIDELNPMKIHSYVSRK